MIFEKTLDILDRISFQKYIVKYTMADEKTQGTVTSSDGTKIYYESIGSGKPLIFCYGVVCNKEQWKHQTTFLKKITKLSTLIIEVTIYPKVLKNLLT